MLKTMLNSKKFMVMATGIVLKLVSTFAPDFVPAVDEILKLIMAYIVGQGLADINKPKV